MSESSKHRNCYGTKYQSTKKFALHWWPWFEGWWRLKRLNGLGLGCKSELFLISYGSILEHVNIYTYIAFILVAFINYINGHPWSIVVLWIRHRPRPIKCTKWWYCTHCLHQSCALLLSNIGINLLLHRSGSKGPLNNNLSTPSLQVLSKVRCFASQRPLLVSPSP